MNLLIIIIVLVNCFLLFAHKVTIDRNEDIGFCGFLLLIYKLRVDKQSKFSSNHEQFSYFVNS